MEMKNIKDAKLLKIAYLIQVGIVVCVIIWTWVTGEYQQVISMEVSKLESQLSNMTHEEALTAATVGILIITALVHFVGWILLASTCEGKNWSKWLFILFCLWQGKLSITSTVSISRMYAGVIGIDDWVITLISFSIYSVLAVKTFMLKFNK